MDASPDTPSRVSRRAGRDARAGGTDLAPWSRSRSLLWLGARACAACTRGHRVLLALEVAEDRPWVDAEIARGLRAIPVVALEHLEDVLALELLFRFLERENRAFATLIELEVLDAEERLVAKNERL